MWPVNSAVRFRPPDRLIGFAVHQQIPEDDRSAMAKAIGRASEASTVAFTIGICFLLGYWLDYSLETSPLFSVIGLALGMITAFLQLLKLAQRISHPLADPKQGSKGNANQTNDQTPEPKS